MAAATLRYSDGRSVELSRVVLLSPTAVTYEDVYGAVRRAEWSPVYDRLDYRSPEQVIASLEAALARATGSTVVAVRLAHGYDGP
jgi:hypothetical protein